MPKQLKNLLKSKSYSLKSYKNLIKSKFFKNLKNAIHFKMSHFHKAISTNILEVGQVTVSPL